MDAAVAKLLASASGPQGADDADDDAVVTAIAALGAPAVPRLKRALADANESTRLVAIEALAKIGGQGAEALIGALADPSDSVRLAAVQRLGELREPKAAAALLDRYGREEDDQVRYESLTTLGLIGDRAAVPLLVSETKSDDPYARMWALDALCEMKDGHAPSLANALLQDPDANVRQQVVRSCSHAFDTPEGHRALIDFALTTPDFQASVWARRNLLNYVQRSGPNGTDVADQVRTTAREALNGPGSLRAALLLGDLADKAATDRLLEALHDPDMWVRHHAAYLLSRIGDRRAVPALAEALRDPVELVSVTAYSSLQWFAKDGDARAQEAIAGYTGKKTTQPLQR